MWHHAEVQVLRFSKTVFSHLKKGDLCCCKNWLGIMLLNMASKVFCKVILERIKTALHEKLREEQAGFRAGQSCTDQIATLRIIVEQSIEWQPSLYINFIDFEKAFDSISRYILWRLLRHYGMPDKIVSIIRVFMRVFPHRWYTIGRRHNH